MEISLKVCARPRDIWIRHHRVSQQLRGSKRGFGSDATDADQRVNRNRSNQELCAGATQRTRRRATRRVIT